jgi:uncharacterized membrane protein YdbT with pleckstrin-like domain
MLRNVKYFYSRIHVHVMDEDAKNQFRWKFYRLTIQLNAIVLLVALSVLGFFFLPYPYRLPLIVIMLVVAAVLSVNFRKSYLSTKVWLDENGQERKES